MIFKRRNASLWGFVFVLFAVLSVGAMPAWAAPINYGDFGPDPPGATRYLQVTESSATDPIPPGRYGEPTLNQNTLDFNPTQFVAFAAGGDLDITDVQLNYTLMTTPLAGATNMLITESGDFTLIGGGTALTQVAAGVAIQIDILAVDGSPLADPISKAFSETFSANLVDDGPIQVAPWGNSLFIDFEAILDDYEVPFELGVSKANIVIDNQLIAISEATSVSFIAKKDFRIRTNVEIVPEPASLAMMFVAVGAFGCVVRRRFVRGRRAA